MLLFEFVKYFVRLENVFFFFTFLFSMILRHINFLPSIDRSLAVKKLSSTNNQLLTVSRQNKNIVLTSAIDFFFF
jgi:hypothetical protein